MKGFKFNKRQWELWGVLAGTLMAYAIIYLINAPKIAYILPIAAQFLASISLAATKHRKPRRVKFNFDILKEKEEASQ